MIRLDKIGVFLGERSYPVYIGPRGFERLGELLERHGLRGTACVVTQKEIWTLWHEYFERVFSACGIPFHVHFPLSKKKSEEAKSFPELVRLVRALGDLDGRGAGVYLVALGGGVVGDLGGFAASIYRRGIPYVQIPTTLTAQVDSGIGGKTGVDLPQGKNLLGTIYQPRFVLADPQFLKTLSPRFLRDGLAEVVKYALIRDAGLLRFLEKNTARILDASPRHLGRVIRLCVRIKAGVVSRDEFDKKGVRLVLNFGHTFAHAIESAASYSAYTHGEAVSIGMMMALGLSDSLGLLKDPGLVPRTERILSAFGLPVRIDKRLGVAKVLYSMGFDKKSLNGKNRFVLMERLNRTVVREGISPDLVAAEIERRKG